MCCQIPARLSALMYISCDQFFYKSHLFCLKNFSHGGRVVFGHGKPDGFSAAAAAASDRR